MDRVKLAFAIAPLAPSIYIFALLGVTSSLNRLNKYSVLMLFLSLFVSYFSCFFLGYPLISVLQKIKKLNIANLVIAGGFSGAFIFFLFSVGTSLILSSPLDYALAIKQLLWGVLFGGMVSVLFGLIAGYPWMRNNELSHW